METTPEIAPNTAQATTQAAPTITYILNIDKHLYDRYVSACRKYDNDPNDVIISAILGITQTLENIPQNEPRSTPAPPNRAARRRAGQ